MQASAQHGDGCVVILDMGLHIAVLERKRIALRLERERLESSLKRKHEAHVTARQQTVTNCEIFSFPRCF